MLKKKKLLPFVLHTFHPFRAVLFPPRHPVNRRIRIRFRNRCSNSHSSSISQTDVTNTKNPFFFTLLKYNKHNTASHVSISFLSYTSTIVITITKHYRFCCCFDLRDVVRCAPGKQLWNNLHHRTASAD